MMRDITEDVPVRGPREEFTTSYGEEGQESDYDALSCAEFEGIPGRPIDDVESLTILHGLGMAEDE